MTSPASRRHITEELHELEVYRTHIAGAVTERLRVYMSVQAMYGAGNALYWNDSERQNSMHLTLLKYPNTKTSLYKLSKNHWVIAFFKNFGSVRKKLQFTVLLDHPVSDNIHRSTNPARNRE